MFSSAKKEIAQEEMSNSSNIIGKGTSLEGNLNTAGNIHVEGRVNGSIQTKAKLDSSSYALSIESTTTPSLAPSSRHSVTLATDPTSNPSYNLFLEPSDIRSDF